MLPSLSLTVSAREDEPINETAARQTTKLTTGFLSFTLTSYNESLATRQGPVSDVIARVDRRRSLAQKRRVDTEARWEKKRRGDGVTGRRGDKKNVAESDASSSCSLHRLVSQ